MSSSAGKRLLSTITVKPTPSKVHFHRPIPDAAFPQGFRLTGVHCGVKKVPGVPDLGIIVSTTPQAASAAACFTKNAFQAAPVLVSQTVLARNNGTARALVVNSGCANAVTGKQGMDNAWSMARQTDKLLPEMKETEQTLVMSTGVIGQQLPISKIISGIQSSASTMGSDFDAWERTAKAFMTTDTFPKLRARSFKLNGRDYRMAGMDKGAGMIHPNMGPPGLPHATLLGCILTDAAITPSSLQSALTYAVDRSFNSISVDGEMSTNDTIVVLANGAGAADGEKHIDEKTDPEAFQVFRQELKDFAVELAQLVVRDGEGATKFVTVTVKGAPTYEDAHKVASRVSTSALVKTALYGEDANWGRVLSAAGSIQLSRPLDPTTVSVTFIPPSSAANTTPLPVLVNGEPESVDEDRASEIMSNEDFEILIDLGLKSDEESVARYWTCDFSYDYVKINGDYRS
jgi:glutamate N-acetyltransferase/amino-acid N-acetyltransferase